MADPRKPSGLARTHGALWYGSLGYRLSWLALPQALVALGVSAFLMGNGIGDLNFGGGKGQAPSDLAGDWAQPMDTVATEDMLNKLRDAAGNEGDAAALAELEALVKEGDAIASFKLGVLYSPYFAGVFPYPPEKDAAKAVELLQPAADAGFYKAFGALGEIYMGEPAPLENRTKGCENLILYEAAPDRQKVGWSDHEIPRMVDAANCLLNELRDKNVAYTVPAPETAAKAMALLEDPLLANDTLALWSRIKYLNRAGGTLAERRQSCPVIDAWMSLTSPQTRGPDDFYIPVSQAICKLSQYDEAPGAPPKAAQEEAAAILSAPDLKNYPGAYANLAWLYLQPWDIYDPLKGCKAVENWVALVGTDKAQIDQQSPMSAINFADCLMGYQPGQSPRKPSPQEMQTVIALAQSAKDRGLPNGDYVLGQIYQFGTGGIPVNPATAMMHYQSCAVSGLTLCDLRLGRIYRFGQIDQPKDPQKAASHLERCAAAGDLDCNAELGALYRIEPSLGAAPEVVLAHLKKSAEGGRSLGAENLAYAYMEGKYGLPKDNDMAAYWLVKSIALPGGAEVRDWLAGTPNALKGAGFWKAFHQELTKTGVYSGPISSEMTTETIAALFKL